MMMNRKDFYANLESQFPNIMYFKRYYLLWLFTCSLLICSSFKTSSSISNYLSVKNRGLFSAVERKLDLDLGERSYPIYIGNGLLAHGEELRKHVRCKKALIVTNTLVGPLYSTTVKKSLEDGGIEVHEVVLPDGEEYKTMEVLMMIINKAMEIKMDRKSVMIALGGGVIGDMTGFAAAIFLRGIKFVQIPTTLMAMVDSSVGGKTAVNHPLGKNMIGSFHQPDAVIIDKDTLVTLKDREFYSGISEIIKYGLIKDADFFQWQEKNMDALVRRDSDSLTEAIFRSCLIKADIVAADEKEGGIRATLNLGHTFGHAIESGMGYGMWLHGEAVGTGIAMAAKLSRLHGYIDETLEERIQNILRLSKLPNTLFNSYAIKETGQDNYDATCVKLTASRFLDLMSNDKKVADGQLNLILLQGSLGNCIITNKFDPNILKSMITEYCNTYVKS